MKRLAYHILCSISLLLCILVLAVWPRSVWRSDSITYRTGANYQLGVSTLPHGLLIGIATHVDGWDKFSVSMGESRATYPGWHASSEPWGVVTSGSRVIDETQPLDDATTQPGVRLIGREMRAEAWTTIHNPPAMDHDLLGFGYTHKTFVPVALPEGGLVPMKPSTHLGISFPLWALALAFAILPLKSLRSYTSRRYRQRHHLCLRCGYDLRASSTCCPECGLPLALGATPNASNMPT